MSAAFRHGSIQAHRPWEHLGFFCFWLCRVSAGAFLRKDSNLAAGGHLGLPTCWSHLAESDPLPPHSHTVNQDPRTVPHWPG